MIDKLTSFDPMTKSLKVEVSLFFLGIFSRILFRSQILHQWDSVNFALALNRYDLTLHQPHPPGMFVLYILAGRAVDFFADDPNVALVTLSVIASGCSAVLMFWLGRAWFGERVGAIAAALFLCSPLTWFQGSVALSYMPEFLWVLLVVLGCGLSCKASKRNAAIFYITSLLLGLSSGVRPNSLFFLFPMWIFIAALGIRQGRYRLRHLAIAVVCGSIGIACWLVPMVTLSGGPEGLYRAMQPWLEAHPKDGLGRSLLDDDVSSALGTYLNFKLLLEAILYGIGFAILPLFWGLFRHGKEILSTLRRDRYAQLLVVWIIPGLAYLIFVHIKRLGHAFTILPAFILLGSLAIAYISRSMGRRQQIAVPVVICFANAIFFLFGPANWTATIPTRATIAEYDTFVSERVAAIEAQFPGERSLVLTHDRYGRAREFYLPNYRGTGLGRSWENFLEQPIPPEVRHLIIFDEKVLAGVDARPEFAEIELPTTGRMRYLSWPDNQRLELTGSAVRLKSQ